MSFICEVLLIQINADRQFAPQLPTSPVQGLSIGGYNYGQGPVIGAAKQIKGTVKQVAGKAVGDAKLEAEGNADKIEGQVQNAIGGVKDTLKGK